MWDDDNDHTFKQLINLKKSVSILLLVGGQNVWDWTKERMVNMGGKVCIIVKPG